ncbi:MAG: MraY family glycosyltransferase [Candidatus Saccharibacteria bacterium]
MAAIITFMAMPLVRKLSQKVGAVAVPSERKIHKSIIPSSGGVAIFLGFLIASLFFNNPSPEIIGFLIGGTVITAVGLLDDIFDLPPITKIFGQVLAALIVISAGVRIEFIGNLGAGNDGLYYLGFLSLPFTFFWIVGITNAINFIDGLDGLAGGVTGIAAWTLGVVSLLSGRYDAAVLSFTLGAAAFAFLPYNFSNSPRKKIFMGDAGSNFLGYSLAVLSILGMVKIAAAFSMLIPILILAVPIFDTGFAIIRRLISGKSPFEADRMHLHHRIMERGVSHRQTTCILYVISLVLGVISIISMNLDPAVIPFVFGATVVVFVLLLWKLGLIKVNLKGK